MIINNNYKYSLPKSLKFGEGCVELYSDFDRTFLPISHEGFKKIPDSSYDPLLQGYFIRMGEFFNKVKQGFTFKITSGRNFDEFQTVAEMARDKGFKMPLPDSLIVKNGGDEHPKIGTDDEFYKGGNYPFKYEVINQEKQADIKQKTGWDGKIIKEKLKKVFEGHGFEVREPGTTNSASDYGYRSLFYDLYKDATEENPYPNVIALRRDGDSKIHITYPMYITEIGKTVDGKYQSAETIFDRAIAKTMKEAGVDFQNHYYNFKKHGIESAHHPAVEIFPSLNKNQTPLTKLYDTQKAVEKAIKENDLVIIAGDSSNDAEMLNIGNYFKPDESIKHPEGYDKELNDEIFKRGEALEETIEKNPQLKKQLEEFPVISIIVKNKDKKAPFVPPPYKKCGKLIEVEEGKLLDGIKQAIKMHAEVNPKYKEKLSPDLFQEIYGVAKDVEKKLKIK